MRPTTKKIASSILTIAVSLLAAAAAATAAPGKVTVCHDGGALEVAASALGPHLAHGDSLGECPVVQPPADDTPPADGEPGSDTTGEPPAPGDTEDPGEPAPEDTTPGSTDETPPADQDDPGPASEDDEPAPGQNDALPEQGTGDESEPGETGDQTGAGETSDADSPPAGTAGSHSSAPPFAGFCAQIPAPRADGTIGVFLHLYEGAENDPYWSKFGLTPALVNPVTGAIYC